MSRDRQRAYAKRRYQKWEAKRIEKEAIRTRNRRNSIVAAVLVAGVIVTVGLLLHNGSKEVPTDVAATNTALTTPSVGPSSGAPSASITGITPRPSSKTWPTAPAKTLAEGKQWTWTLQTNHGPIVMKLDGAAAPQAVSSIVFLTQNTFYDRTPCHRVTTDGLYVLQCGSPSGAGDGNPGYSYGPIENAPQDGVYKAGTVAMANSGSPDSNGSQFFLVYKDTTLSPNYSAVGTISSGLDVVKANAAAGVQGGGTDGAPAQPISITTATIARS